MKQFVYPKRIVEKKNVENCRALFIKRPLQVDLYESNLAVTSEDGGYLILDFGKEMRGGIRVLTVNVKGGVTSKVRIRFGESLTECCAELGEKNATNDHSPRDICYDLPFASDVSIGDTGYRFVRIDFPKGYSLGIKNIVGTNNILRLPLKNAYKGNDKIIAKIFNTAKRTLDLCAYGEYIWDGIKRDRLVWSGDLYPEIIALTYLYGGVKQIENTLDFESTRAKYKGEWISMLTTYSMWWVACVAEYYFNTGAKDFIFKQLPYVKEIIKQFNGLISENGEMNYPNCFVDWATVGSADEELGARFISIFAVKKVIKMFNTLEEDVATAEVLLQKLLNSEFTVKEKKQVIALKYFALGKISKNEYAKLIEGGAKGFSTFMSYFVLTAIASEDRKLSIELMKEYYGGMIDKGATTFWEDFDIDWVEGSGRIDCFPRKNEKDIHGDYGRHCYEGFRHSLCHAWSSGIIKFIAENCE